MEITATSTFGSNHANLPCTTNQKKMRLLNRVTSLSKHALIVAKHVLGKSILCQPLSTPTLTIARSPNAG